jgi:hypothetical protein
VELSGIALQRMKQNIHYQPPQNRKPPIPEMPINKGIIKPSAAA